MNRGHILKNVRLEYNAHQLMDRHRARVIELLRKMDFSLSENKGRIQFDAKVDGEKGRLMLERVKENPEDQMFACAEELKAE